MNFILRNNNLSLLLFPLKKFKEFLLRPDGLKITLNLKKQLNNLKIKRSKGMMVNKNLTLTSCILLLVTMITACHKYPEDEFITYVKPEKRIMGFYNMTHYYVNNTDSIFSPRYYYFSYGKPVEFATYYDPAILVFDFGMYNQYTGSWRFAVNFFDNNQFLHFRNIPDTIFNYGLIPFVVNESTWRILKLTDSQLILSSTIGKNFYELHFEK